MPFTLGNYTETMGEKYDSKDAPLFNDYRDDYPNAEFETGFEARYGGLNPGNYASNTMETGRQSGLGPGPSGGGWGQGFAR